MLNIDRYFPVGTLMNRFSGPLLVCTVALQRFDRVFVNVVFLYMKTRACFAANYLPLSGELLFVSAACQLWAVAVQ